DGIRDATVTGVQTCALPISAVPCLTPLLRKQQDGGKPIWRSVRQRGVRQGTAANASLMFPDKPPHWQMDAIFSPAAACASRDHEIGRASCRERGWTSGGVRR